MPFFAGVGGIEAEAVMLGQPISMVLPQVIGYRLLGNPCPLVTSTDIVLTITKVTRAPCLLTGFESHSDRQEGIHDGALWVSVCSGSSRKQPVDDLKKR